MMLIVKFLCVNQVSDSFLSHPWVRHGHYSYSRRLFVDLRKLKMFCTHRQKLMEFKNDPTDFYEKHDCFS